MAHFLPHRRDSDTSGHAPRAGVKSQTKSQGTMAGRSDSPPGRRSCGAFDRSARTARISTSVSASPSARAARMSLKEIAKTLNAEKVPTIHGTNRWTAASVRKAFVS